MPASTLAGTLRGRQMLLGPGSARLTLPFGTTVLDIPLKGARVRATLDASGKTLRDGVIGGGIGTDTINTQLVPVFAQQLNAMYQSPGTSAQVKAQLRQLFDTNADGTISAAELGGNALLKTFLAGDVDVDGDGVRELSIGVGFTAVGATLVR